MIKVGCDLFLDLKLYKVPDIELDSLKREFPQFEIVPVNCPNLSENIDYSEIEVYWGNRINKQIINSCPNLKWIHFGSLGVNNARIQETIDRKIKVTNSKGTVERSVAMTAIAYLFSLSRGLKKGSDLSYWNNFSRSGFDSYFETMADLEDLNVLIVGYGEIGKIIAKFIKPFSRKISAVVKNPNNRKDDYILEFYNLDNLCNAVKNVDVIFNVLPLTDSTRRVFDSKVFSNMTSKSFFINVGRGETVDEEVMIQFLLDGKIAGVGLDVFENEPLSSDSKLHSIENAIITPHIAAISPNYWKKEIDLVKENFSRYLSGKTLLNLIDLNAGY